MTSKKIKNLNALYLKGSFEDEGISLFDLQDLMINSNKIRIPVAIKVGGCEARNDIKNCLRAGVSSIVAPMIESNFAAQKFIQAMDSLCAYNIVDKHINIETQAACINIKNILENNHENLTGIVVGRSDLACSMGLTKKDVDSQEIIKYVEKSLIAAKQLGLTTTLGGSVGARSAEIIANFSYKGLLDRFETRAVVFSAAIDTEYIKKQINTAIEYEIELLKERRDFHSKLVEKHENRIKIMMERK